MKKFEPLLLALLAFIVILIGLAFSHSDNGAGPSRIIASARVTLLI